MYLTNLNERQKELFIQLSIHAALANDILEDAEATLISEYCKEMAIENPGVEVKMDLKDVLLELKAISSEQELNIITFEIAALFVFDNEYDKDEKCFMNKLIQVFNIDKEKLKKMFDHINEYSQLVGRITSNLLD
jgi:hypothetical protein